MGSKNKLKFVLYILKIKIQSLHASCITIVLFHIIKFNDRDHTIFQVCDDSSMTIIMKMIWNDISWHKLLQCGCN